MTDASDAQIARCDPTKPFGAPTKLAGFPDGQNLAPRATDDERTVYYSWQDPSGDSQIYYAHRNSIAEPFTDQTKLTFPEVADAGRHYQPAFLASQLTMLLSAGSPPLRDLYIATRGGAAITPFVTMTRIDAISTSDDELAPYLARAGEMLYFVRSVAVGATAVTRIYRASKSGASYAGATPVQELGDNVHFPVVSDDELTIYFGRMTGATIATFDVFVGTRATTDQPFGDIHQVPGANDPGVLDLPVWRSSDDCVLWVRTQREGDGYDHVWVARRPL